MSVITADDEAPSPPAAVVIAGLMRLIASGLEAIEVPRWGPLVSSGVLTGSGWWLMLRSDDQGDPVEVLHAQPPSALVPPWIYGGQRDDWTLGPDARVVTPMELLTLEQRAQLRKRLEDAPRPPQFAPLPYWDVDWTGSDDELILD